MTARSRLLGGVTTSPPPQPQDSSSTASALDSDFVVILAALLCALICVLGLVGVARCACIRRFSFPSSSSSHSLAANKGLKKKVLKSLPMVTYGRHEDSGDQAKKLSDCAICLADFAPGEEIRLLPQCGHGFHVICIDTWLATHSSCPSCRQVLARCQKCGRLPPAARIQAEPRESHINSYLP